MKIHNRFQFFQGLAYLALGVLYLARGVAERRGFGITMGILWMILALVAVCFSMDGERAAQGREQEDRTRRAAEKRYGSWAWPVRLAGGAAVVPGVALLLLGRRFSLWGVLLVLAGLLYTIAVEFKLKNLAEREE